MLPTNARANGWIATESRRDTARRPSPAKRGALKPPRQKRKHRGRSRDSLARCNWNLRAGAASRHRMSRRNYMIFGSRRRAGHAAAALRNEPPRQRPKRKKSKTPRHGDGV
eukprot:5997913-Pyramimonas_sp.AAC.1